MRSGWIGLGPKTEEFEERFARRVGSRYAVELNSATAAFHLALELADVGPGDEVLVPTMTFVSTAMAANYQGAVPVFCDVDRATCLDVGDAERRRTLRTRAAIPMLYGGHAPDECDGGAAHLTACPAGAFVPRS
jgi:perosamine synthetase